VKNGERYTLARIPLRWMIRECFRVDTGIIFDAHMLMHEVGLDIDSITEAPEPLSSKKHALRRLKATELAGFSFRRRIPFAIISALGSPFRWARDKMSNLRSRDSKQLVCPIGRVKPVFESEPLEELNDALSPIVDQIEVQPAWNIVEWIPCKLSPLTHPHWGR